MDIARALSVPVEFKGFEDPKLTLGEALDAFTRLYHVSFDVDEAAFADQGIADILKLEFLSNAPLPELRAPLGRVLRKVLRRVPGATFVIRNDHIEITTTTAVVVEFGIQPNPLRESRVLPTLVYTEFEDTPLAAALKKLAHDSALSVILDPGTAAGEKKVTADFHNVPLETAVRVLADMTDLMVVRLDNVLYLTLPEKAARLQAEYKPAADAKKGAPPTKPKPTM
jgi:hypothetical protein